MSTASAPSTAPGSVNMPGSRTTTLPSCSIRTQAWPNFVIRMPLRCHRAPGHRTGRRSRRAPYDARVTYFDLADPAFDVTSAQVHAARDEDWYVETNWGWAVLRHAEVSAVLRDRRFRQGNARWPAQNGIHSGLFSDWWQENLLSLGGGDHPPIPRPVMPALPEKTNAGV